MVRKISLSWKSCRPGIELQSITCAHQMLTYFDPIVKFDSDQLPPILNALETENGGQKLILEVAVRWSSDYAHT